MKRSERLLRNTVFLLAGLVVIHVGVSRVLAGSAALRTARGTSAADLARLRGFDAIEVSGNLEVDAVQAAGYSVVSRGGNLVATVRDKTLVLQGTGAGVRVTLPTLVGMSVRGTSAIAISGVSGSSLSLRLEEPAQVTLRNNGIRQWRIVAPEKAELRVDRASLSAGQFDFTGRLTLTVID